jgi:hypothetical protein
MIINYIIYFITFLLGQIFTIWGQFYTLKYKNITMIEAIIKALPFAWISWFFIAIAIGLGGQYNLVTPFQNIMLLIILQFTLIALINQFWLNQKITRSDVITFFIIILGFFVSLNHVITNNFM